MTERDPTAEGTTLTEHVADAPVPDRVHVPLGVKLTAPVGVAALEVEVSVTVAVHEVAEPVLTEEGEHVITVAVDRTVAVIVELPALVPWDVSPA